MMSALLVIFEVAKQKRLNQGKKYTFFRPADIWTVNKIAKS